MKSFPFEGASRNGLFSLPREIALGWFLAVRSVRRASIGTSLLIILIQTLTVLNLLLVNGILVGLIEGTETTYSESYAGDVIVTPIVTRSELESTKELFETAKNDPSVAAVTRRYTASARIQAIPARTNLEDEFNEADMVVAGINPLEENNVTRLSEEIIAGRWLEPTDTHGIVVGNRLLDQYFEVPVERGLLRGVELNERVRVIFGEESSRDFRIIGILFSKIDLVARRAYILDRELLALSGKHNLEAGEIAIRLQPGTDTASWIAGYERTLVEDRNQVESAAESIGEFFSEVTDTFALIGNIIGGIALIVAAVTVFIITFINAFMRRKFIGILKGIGISERSIEFAYVLQAIFYALIGILIGVAIILILDPYFDRNPIDFPFSDGILSVTTPGIFLRSLLLLGVTAIAGYIPARYITHGNTLDAILGR